MRNLAEARSYQDRIEFYIAEKDLVVVSKRDTNGEVVIEKRKGINQLKKIGFSYTKRAWLFLIVLVFSLMLQFSGNIKIQMLILLAFVWLIAYLFFYTRSKQKQMHRYHAAEHKVLNYLDKFQKVPEIVEEVIEMPSISIRCGSTVIAVTLVLLSLLMIGILFVPTIQLKVLSCSLGTFLTIYLWANGKLDFFQKQVLEEPSVKEVEVAFVGLKEYLKEKEA